MDHTSDNSYNNIIAAGSMGLRLAEVISSMSENRNNASNDTAGITIPITGEFDPKSISGWHYLKPNGR